MIDWTRIKSFTRAETACSCCGENEMNPQFMETLQAIRDEYGKPMIVTSAYRCPSWNERVGGGPEHPMGEAVDIAVENPGAMELVTICVRHGIRRIGIAQRNGKPRFIHIGGADDLPVGIWSY